MDEKIELGSAGASFRDCALTPYTVTETTEYQGRKKKELQNAMNYYYLLFVQMPRKYVYTYIYIYS